MSHKSWQKMGRGQQTETRRHPGTKENGKLVLGFHKRGIGSLIYTLPCFSFLITLMDTFKASHTSSLTTTRTIKGREYAHFRWYLTERTATNDPLPHNATLCKTFTHQSRASITGRGPSIIPVLLSPSTAALETWNYCLVAAVRDELHNESDTNSRSVSTWLFITGKLASLILHFCFPAVTMSPFKLPSPVWW